MTNKWSVKHGQTWKWEIFVSPENLVLQAFLGDGEVDDGDLDADLGEVGRVGHLAGHVEAEMFVVVDVAVTQVDQQTAALQRWWKSGEKLVK